jgi:hypothetical protein
MDKYDVTTTDDNVLFDELTTTFTISAEIHDKIHAGVDFSGRFCLPSAGRRFHAAGRFFLPSSTLGTFIYLLAAGRFLTGRLCFDRIIIP